MDLLEGYPRLAGFIGQHPGMAVFRRFERLNAQSLLYQEAEICHLERELDTIANRDHHRSSRDSKCQSFSTYAFELRRAQGPDSLQWQKALEIRQRLKEYNDTLLQHAALYRLAKPNSYDLKILRDWMGRAHGGNHFLRGLEAGILDSPDLVALSSREDHTDPLTRWISEILTPWYDRQVRRYRRNIPSQDKDEEHGLDIHSYDDAKLNTAARVISVVISSILPAASILALYCVQNTPARLGMVLAFSVSFSAVLALCTSARRVEIFAASAAFASVQVVFVGSVNRATG